MEKCTATTRKGSRCGNNAIEGSEYCRVHAESAEETSGCCDDVREEFGDGLSTAFKVLVAGAAVLIMLRLGRRM